LELYPGGVTATKQRIKDKTYIEDKKSLFVRKSMKSLPSKGTKKV